MKKLVIVVVLVFLSALTIAAQTIAFTNVNVIPMDRERVLANQTVLIELAEVMSREQ